MHAAVLRFGFTATCKESVFTVLHDKLLYASVDPIMKVLHGFVLHIVFRNPVGRTGVRGRGCLGRWGPNHAADPIVTRYLDTSGRLNVACGVVVLR